MSVDSSNNDWTATISVNDYDGQTRASVRVRCGRKEWAGAGLSRLSAVEHGVGCTGGELAVARAFADLSRRMMAAAARDIETAAVP
jgi:hypothetical protein